MRLSEAIRLGAMLRPQGRVAAISEHGSCAIGAACEAIGAKQGVTLAWARTQFPILNVRCDVPREVEFKNPEMLRAIWFLNDYCNWTRERIADWVETIEAQHPELYNDSAPVELASKPETVSQ